jgi:hypothetical protein
VIVIYNMHMKNQYPSTVYIRNLHLFGERTQELADKIFSLTLQILFFKYKRKCEEYETTLEIRKRKGKKKKLVAANPLLLKEKDISNAISLVDFHLKAKEEISVNKNKDLMKLFSSVSLDTALKFYDEYLKKGVIKDRMGREIIFDDDGKAFLYKERTEKGRHVASAENYAESRGKRLSWIEPVLSSTRQIYKEIETYWQAYLYVGILNIQVKMGTIMEETHKNHFLVVTRKEKGKPLRFVTAYFMESQSELFKHLEKTVPVSLEEQEYTRSGHF